MSGTPAGGPRGHSLVLESIAHSFGLFTAVRDVDLRIGAGEFVALLGPSGCGKTTLLRIISGFINQTQGRILFDGAPVDHLAPNLRNVGIVFQNYALFPHMTVAENVAYGLEARRMRKDRVRARVAEMLAMVHLDALAGRLPRELSGGQQQRVALARALAPDPKILLLDEPFAALDKSLRLDMQIEVKRLQSAYGVTTILVTHDQEEALSLADRIAVMDAGAIEQVAAPTEIYDQPATLFVNRFVGHTNLLPGTLVRSDRASADVRLDEGTTLPCGGGAGLAPGTSILLSVRPERLRVSRENGAGAVPATVKIVLPLGAHVIYECEVGQGVPVKVNLPRELGTALMRSGERIYLRPATPDACQIFARSA